MDRRKLTFRLILLTILPASMLELMNNIYNLYVPIYLQAGGPTFNKAVVTFGFGVGAFYVGFWLVVDNILSFIFSPFVGARSDRTRSRLGRRLPFILGSLPLLIIGYALIPMGPARIPAELNGQQSRLTGLFIFFLGSCAVYFMGFVPVRSILQTLRQEAVALPDRPKVESWYISIVNAFTIGALLYGRKLYELSGPLIFWTVLGMYVLSATATLVFYKEPQELAQAAAVRKASNLKQILSIFKEAPPGTSRNILFYLASVMFYGLALSAFLNFSPSWVVNTLGVDESRMAGTMAVFFWVAATVTPLPMGYLAGKALKRRHLYVLGILTTLGASLVLFLAPRLYPVGLAGLGAGLAITLNFQLPLASEVVYDKKALGTMVGLYNFVYMFGVLLGANSAGLLIQKTSYRALYPVVAVFSFAAAVLASFIRTGSGGDDAAGR